MEKRDREIESSLKKLKDEQKYYQKFVDKVQKRPSLAPIMKKCIEYALQRVNEITEALFLQGKL